MRNIQNLEKNLLSSEFDIANEIFYALRGQGYSPAKVTAMIYRHGRLDGVESQKDEVKKAYRSLDALKAAYTQRHTDEQPISVEQDEPTDNESEGEDNG